MSDELQFKLRGWPVTEEECRGFAAQVMFAIRPDPAFAAAVAALNEQAARLTAAMVCSMQEMCAPAAVPKFTLPALPPETLEVLRSIAAREAVARCAFAPAAPSPPRLRIDVVIHAEGEM
ncbi:MAG TPA: hypothetical protein VE713_03470 [Pyrinomonadaceae bacterium]|jgi:hypothetical protein|nr:hypothetical protein [Pyrinomonadaceae bacterium]